MSDDHSPSAGAPLPLFYRRPVPLSFQEHKELSLRTNFGYYFAAKVNAVPVNLVEIPQLQHHYPIAFSPDGKATPVAILGLRDDENLFVDEQGQWLAHTYVPAYVRRYPFIFADSGGDQLTLCVDVGGEAVVEGRSTPFWNLDGKPSSISESALEFCKSYHAAASQTLEFSRMLSQLGLLVERAAEINLPGRSIQFSGFALIDEERLRTLPDPLFLQLRHLGYLPALDAALFSGSQWSRLSRLLHERLAAQGEVASPDEALMRATGGGPAAAQPYEPVPAEDREFADRLAAKAHFEDTVAAARAGRKLIAAYSGVHGAGKSRFFRQLRLHCRERGAALHVAYFQFPREGSPSVTDVLNALANGLIRDYGVRAKRYDYAQRLLAAARRISEEQASLARTKRELVLDESGRAVSAGVQSVPFGGAMIDYVSKRALSAMRDFLDKQSSYREEVESELRDHAGAILEPNEIERRLAGLLARDLDESYAEADQPLLVLLVDEYERAWPSADAVRENTSMPVDEALRDLLAGLARGVAAVFTRQTPAWDKDPRLESHLAEPWGYQLEPFSDDDSRNFLRRYIAEPEIVEVIVENAKGNPGLLNLQLDKYQEILAAQKRRPGRDDFLVSPGETVASNMLRDQRPEYRQLFEVLSGFRFFDRPLFEAAVRRFNIPISLNQFRRVCELSFIEPVDAGAGTFRIREVVGDVLEQRSDPEDRTQVRRLAAEHFEQRLAQARQQSRHGAGKPVAEVSFAEAGEHDPDEEQIRLALESFYYRYRLEAGSAVDWIIQQVDALAQSFRHAEATDLIQRALMEFDREGGGTEHRVHLEMTLTRTLRSQGSIARARRQAMSTLQRARGTRDAYLYFQAARSLVSCLIAEGSAVEAEEQLRGMEEIVGVLGTGGGWTPADLALFERQLNETAIEVYEMVGRYSLAETLVEKHDRLLQSAQGAPPSPVPRIYWLRQGAILHHRRGDLEEAAARYRRAAVLAEEHPESGAWAGVCRLNLAMAELERGDTRAAGEALRQAGEALNPLLPEESPFRTLLQGTEGAFQAALGRHQVALPLLARARRELLHHFGYGSGFVSRLTCWQAESLLALGRISNAVALLRQEIRRLQDQLGIGHPWLPALLPTLVSALEQAAGDGALIEPELAADTVAELQSRAEENRRRLQGRNRLAIPGRDVGGDALPGGEPGRRLAEHLAAVSDPDRPHRRYLQVPFYPQAVLAVLTYPGPVPCELYLAMVDGEVILLDPSRPTLADLNRRALQLDDGNVAEYVRFHLGLNRFAGRSPVLIESLADFPEELDLTTEGLEQVDREVFRLRLLRGGGTGGWLLRGCILRDLDLQAADIRVDGDGEVAFVRANSLRSGFERRAPQPLPEALEKLLFVDASAVEPAAGEEPETATPEARTPPAGDDGGAVFEVGPPRTLLPGDWQVLGSEEARSLAEEFFRSDREVEDAVLSDGGSLLAVQRLPLTCLEGFLYQLNLRFESSSAALDCLRTDAGWTILDGTSKPFGDLWAGGHVHHDSDERIGEYVRLFTSALRGDEGRFQIVEGIEDVPLRPEAALQEPGLGIQPLRSWRAGNARLLHRATILYGVGLFEVQLTLNRLHGLVEMTADDPIVWGLPVVAETYRGPLRLLDPGAPPRQERSTVGVWSGGSPSR